MIQRLAPLNGRANVHPQVRLDSFLANILVQALGAQSRVKELLPIFPDGVANGVHNAAHKLPPERMRKLADRRWLMVP